MPLYHFHVVKGRKKLDPNAIELPNDESAKRHGEHLADGLTTLSRGFGIRYLGDWHVAVTDAKGNSVTRCEVGMMRHVNTPGRRAYTRDYVPKAGGERCMWPALKRDRA
jgi:hypothetical protein